MPGVLPETTWRSDEITSGGHPCGIAASATVKSKLPPPCPTSKITPRFLATRAAGKSFPSWTMFVNCPAKLGAPQLGVGQDVAGAEEVEDGAHQGRGFHPADVHHHFSRTA